MENQGLSLEGIGFLVQLPLNVLAEPKLLRIFRRGNNVRMYTCVPLHVWQSEDNWGELFFPLWVSGIELRSSAFTSLY